MIKTFESELLAEKLLKQDDRVVVGVSGGPDSMALLHLFVELNSRPDWNLQLHVAHLNHGLRGESGDQDAAFVQAFCDSHNLPCTIERRDIAELASEDPGGLEEVGRRERYTFFERVCIRADAKVVAVGHHADDNAETILYRILRGTGLRGLAGIPKSRLIAPRSEIRLIRPMLRFSRQSMLNFLDDQGIAYREDETNTSNEMMRNRIRNTLLPKLEADVNPQARDALNRLGEQASWLEEYLRETVQRTFETLIVSHTDQELVLNVDALARKSRIVQTEIVRLAYASFGLGEQDLSFSHLVSALDIIQDPASGRKTKLPSGMTIEKRYHQLLFSLPSDDPKEYIADEIAVHLPGKTVLPLRRLVIDCSVEEVTAADIAQLRGRATQNEEFVDMDAVTPPLIVRGKRSGERFFPLGAPGSKKLSDFLADAKVDPKEREKVALVCDHFGPIWLIGHRIDDRVKLTELTRKVLHLRATFLNA